MIEITTNYAFCRPLRSLRSEDEKCMFCDEMADQYCEVLATETKLNGSATRGYVYGNVCPECRVLMK